MQAWLNWCVNRSFTKLFKRIEFNSICSFKIFYYYKWFYVLYCSMYCVLSKCWFSSMSKCVMLYGNSVAPSKSHFIQLICKTYWNHHHHHAHYTFQLRSFEKYWRINRAYSYASLIKFHSHQLITIVYPFKLFRVN